MEKEQEKICEKCLKTKKISEFYKRTSKWREKIYYSFRKNCKECEIKRSQKFIENNPEKRDKYYKKAKENYQESTKDKLPKIKKDISEINAGKLAKILRYNSKNPLKLRSRQIMANAILNGSLKRKACLFCKRGGISSDPLKSEGHHENYDYPLEVIWLCKKHHKQLHDNKITL